MHARTHVHAHTHTHTHTHTHAPAVIQFLGCKNADDGKSLLDVNF
jgi:hypothetical protein